jgi:hypothetical protein
LIAGAWLVGTAALAGAAVPPLLETLRWTAPGSELEVLSTQPSACLYDDPRNEPLVQAGQALFNTPTLLGGQAAKAGLSCASCHVNGRDNPHFLINGVSDGPGTADVTNSFFSAARSNGKFDPVPIPDLAAPGKILRDPAARKLEPFIRTLIVEEFAGQEPTPAMLDALSAYVRAIQACPGGDNLTTSRRLADQLILLNRALAGAGDMAKLGERQTADLLIMAARHQLGLISERYVGAKLKRERALLLAASRELQGLAENGNSDTTIADWQSRFEKGLAERLFQKESQSLYNPTRLRTLVAPQRESR